MSELVTGHAGVAHIDTNDMRTKNIGLLGGGNYYLAEVSDNVNVQAAEHITVPAMGIIVSGYFCILDGTDEVTIYPSSGGWRKDYIVARLKNTEGIDSLEIDVLIGTPGTTEGEAVLPTPTDTSEIKEYPLYEVTVNGFTYVRATCMLSEIRALSRTQNRTVPISEGGTGVTSKAALLNMLGLTGKLGTITASTQIAEVTLASALTYYEICTMVLQPGTYSVKAAAVFAKGPQGVDTIQIYDKTANTSRGIKDAEHISDLDLVDMMTHDFRVDTETTIVLRCRCSEPNRKVKNAYLRATCIK